MRGLLVFLVLLAGCGRTGGESLGRMGGAPPSLILTSSMMAANGAVLGEANLYEEVQGDRLVLKLRGLPPGRHGVDLHAAAQCSGSSFVDAGPALEPAMPALEIEDGGAGDYYADLPLPRLRGAAEPRLDGDGMAVTVQVAGMAVGCATFRLPPR